MTQEKTSQQKLLLLALLGYTLSLTLLLGGRLGIVFAYQEGRLLPNDYIIFGALLTNALFLAGLFRPEERKLLLAMSVLFRTLIWWHGYAAEMGSIVYGIFSFPINAIMEALLISCLLSTKRGKFLKGTTIGFMCLRAVSAAAVLGGSMPPVFALATSLALSLRCAALICLVLALGGKKQERKALPPLNESFLAEAEREKTAYLCIHCGRDNPFGQRKCAHCGRALAEDLSLLEERYEAGEEQEHLDLLFRELGCEKFFDLLSCPERLELRANWRKAVETARGENKERLKKIRRLIYNCYEEQRLEKRYAQALSLRRSGQIQELIESAETFAGIAVYRDAQEQAEISLRQGKEQLYLEAQREAAAQNWGSARELYGRIPGWKDAGEQEQHCKKMYERSLSALHGWSPVKRGLFFGAGVLLGLTVFLLLI